MIGIVGFVGRILAIQARVLFPSHAFTPRRCLAAPPNVTRFIWFCALLDELFQLIVIGLRVRRESIELCVEPIPHSLFDPTKNRFVTNPKATAAD